MPPSDAERQRAQADISEADAQIAKLRRVVNQMTDADKKRMLQMKITEHMRNREEAAKILRG